MEQKLFTTVVQKQLNGHVDHVYVQSLAFLLYLSCLNDYIRVDRPEACLKTQVEQTL